MKTKTVLQMIVIVALAASAFAQSPSPTQQPRSDGPFGFRRGMTRAQVLAAVGQSSVDTTLGGEDTLVVTVAPRPHPSFTKYVMIISPTDGLLKMLAFGKDVETNDFGNQLRDEFDSIVAGVTSAYGKPTRADGLQSGSIWNAPNEWMMSLLKKERILQYDWDVSSTKPNRIETVTVSAVAVSEHHGFVDLTYEFDGFSAYAEAVVAKRNRAF
jgi:hypothetical protein